MRRLLRRVDHAVRHLLTVAGIANVDSGCCSCGHWTHDWIYWGACAKTPGDDPARADWAQCDRCHTDPVHACLLLLPHAPAGSRRPTDQPRTTS